MRKGNRSVSILAGLFVGLAPSITSASTFLWKISTDPGHVLYLGGSWHALRSSDYPLPAAFNQALDASSKLVLEVDPSDMRAADESITKAGTYPKGDRLKNHVDPRTYDYVRRFFALLDVPEAKFTRYRPWFIALMLQSPNSRGMSTKLGVEEFLTKRARAQSKPILGLESAREHADVFIGLSDRQSEALLLLTFIPGESGTSEYARLMNAWRRGDAEVPWRLIHDGFRDFPSLGERILEARNRHWLPKIENYLHSGQTYFVVVGAAHMGGPHGLLALLQTRGYKIEQL